MKVEHYVHPHFRDAFVLAKIIIPLVYELYREYIVSAFFSICVCVCTRGVPEMRGKVM